MTLFAWSAVLAVLAAGSWWVAGSGVWDVPLAGNASRTAPAFGARNAIVLLSAGLDHWKPDAPFGPTTDGMSRIRQAAADYAACRAQARVCKVIISGGDPEGHGIADAELYAGEIAALGVREDDVIREARSNTTYENAKFVEPLLQGGHYDAVVLVTSAYHMRRAKIAFDRLGFDVIPDAAPADRAEFSLVPRRQNFRLAWRALHELGGIVQLYLYDWTSIH
ncbi:YdcF family protein [Caballeronia sp. Lep1P3]|uniref:YdcF family protein n=1 Tax=Caballeronia sp. Lep1P3 TaxID=2878150 RepID=UPI001FD56797|nr:YdcF family protein [Caballeronia sp. Lep1P3]